MKLMFFRSVLGNLSAGIKTRILVMSRASETFFMRLLMVALIEIGALIIAEIVSMAECNLWFRLKLHVSTRFERRLLIELIV